jgi:hypothetical protein
MSRALLLAAAAIASTACSKDPASAEKKPPEPKPVEKDRSEEKKPEAPIDPATFVAADLSSVPALAGHTAKAPPGAKVTADAVPGEPKPKGAVLAKDDFALHLWWGTIGGQRTSLPMTAAMKAEMKGEGNAKYVETACEPGSGTCDYTIEAGGRKRYGFFRQVDRRDDADLSSGDSQLLCGPANEVASAEALAPYRAACASVARKK